MTIHVSIKGAFGKDPTGVENYIRELLKSWCEMKLSDLDFVCYYKEKPEDDSLFLKLKDSDFFKLKQVRFPYLWTQLGISYFLFSAFAKAMADRLISYLGHKSQDNDSGSAKFRDQVPVSSVLFVPAHVLPLYCGMPAVVTIHGLEYEHYPEHYSTLHRWYLRLMTRLSCRRAEKIIAVSESTKKDLVEFYDVDEGKISVVYHGVETPMNADESHESRVMSQELKKGTDYGLRITGYEYILYLGRIELKKNILNMIRAFEVLKESPQSTVDGRQLKLVLAGGKGYGYGRINNKLQMTLESRRVQGEANYKEDIIEAGYVTEEEKWRLLKNARVFCFATCYEGFGMPILEAQAVGTSVVTSKGGASEEIADSSAFLVDPESPKEIAKGLKMVLADEKLKAKLVKKGRENVKKFSWKKCGKKTLGVICGWKPQVRS